MIDDQLWKRPKHQSCKYVPERRNDEPKKYHFSDRRFNYQSFIFRSFLDIVENTGLKHSVGCSEVGVILVLRVVVPKYELQGTETRVKDDGGRERVKRGRYGYGVFYKIGVSNTQNRTFLDLVSLCLYLLNGMTLSPIKKGHRVRLDQRNTHKPVYTRYIPINKSQTIQDPRPLCRHSSVRARYLEGHKNPSILL